MSLAVAAAVGAAPSKLLLPTSQNSNTLNFLPPSILSPLSFPTPSCLHSSLTFSLKNLHSLSSPTLCTAFNSQNLQFVTSNFNEEEEEFEEEEQVIGDCLVFEDGIFEDPYLEEQISSISITTQNPRNTQKATEVIEPQNLVPDEWKQVVEEINLTKKDRRKIAQELEFGSKIEKKNRVRNVNLEEYLKVRNEKLSQLKPLVLDNPPAFSSKNGGNGDDGEVKSRRENVNSGESSRVEPKNPRWAVYGRGLDDITEFFNNGNYQPSEKTDAKVGRQMLFTKEEKTLLNSKKPKLDVATSQKWLPLHALAASGEFYLLNSLVKYDVDINAADQNGATLMHYAVRTASSQTIKTLLLHNIDINLQDNDGWSPLHLAVQTRRTDIVRLLLMRGADKTLKNKDGLTPLELCLYSGRDTKTYELIKLLKHLPRQHR
ncbi:ankyrin repeat domain-containing protein, chloroplastic isoform X2 [Beta vulgaris subsp. vulgaris]|uniref:ankyrin repeat domain-containing protein, chloroplastic isoform X2 n=1 Tax=Beta vulgaris subsp. vulgaris TaxID=3555 RepID=UPI0020370E6F|nr:ankyrin repeat domain-containing protein, chloroplastic isoform X2 [Beta vulgaris subsp. vulgaris]